MKEEQIHWTEQMETSFSLPKLYLYLSYSPAINPFAPNDDFARRWKSALLGPVGGSPGPEDSKKVRHFAVAPKLKKLEQF